MTRYWILVILLMSGCSSTVQTASEVQQIQIPTSAPVTTDIAGKAAAAVRQGVLRVVCRASSFGGTGFLHKSGNIITAAHVVKNCNLPDLILITPAGQGFTVANVQADDTVDLALVRPGAAVPGQPLSIATATPLAVGMQVATWGYPGGYDGLVPLLSVGYVAGTQEFKDDSGVTVQRWVVNAAFNGGNSGGPVLSLETGNIVGVVSSKLAPVPPHIATILNLLEKQKFGFTYEGKSPMGPKSHIRKDSSSVRSFSICVAKFSW